MRTLKLYGIKISASERAGDRIFKKASKDIHTSSFVWLTVRWASTLGYSCHSDCWIAQFYNWFLIDILRYLWNVGPWFLTEADKIILEPSASWNDDRLYFLLQESKSAYILTSFENRGGRDAPAPLDLLGRPPGPTIVTHFLDDPLISEIEIVCSVHIDYLSGFGDSSVDLPFIHFYSLFLLNWGFKDRGCCLLYRL